MAIFNNNLLKKIIYMYFGFNYAKIHINMDILLPKYINSDIILFKQCLVVKEFYEKPENLQSTDQY